MRFREPGTNQFLVVRSLVGEVSSEAESLEVVSLAALVVEADHGAVVRLDPVLAEVGFNRWLHSLANVGVRETLIDFTAIVSELVSDVKFFIDDEVIGCLELWNRWGRSLGHQGWCWSLSLRSDFLVTSRGAFLGIHSFCGVLKNLLFVDFDGFPSSRSGFIRGCRQRGRC